MFIKKNTNKHVITNLSTYLIDNVPIINVMNNSSVVIVYCHLKDFFLSERENMYFAEEHNEIIIIPKRNELIFSYMMEV